MVLFKNLDSSVDTNNNSDELRLHFQVHGPILNHNLLNYQMTLLKI